jgi:hypothetical protein
VDLDDTQPVELEGHAAAGHDRHGRRHPTRDDELVRAQLLPLGGELVGQPGDNCWAR